MTISSPHIIATMLKNKGCYPGDPPVEGIFQYKTPEGKSAFAISLPNNPFIPSVYTLNPKLLFHTNQGGITELGQKFLKDFKEATKKKKETETPSL